MSVLTTDPTAVPLGIRTGIGLLPFGVVTGPPKVPIANSRPCPITKRSPYPRRLSDSPNRHCPKSVHSAAPPIFRGPTSSDCHVRRGLSRKYYPSHIRTKITGPASFPIRFRSRTRSSALSRCGLSSSRRAFTSHSGGTVQAVPIKYCAESDIKLVALLP